MKTIPLVLTALALLAVSLAAAETSPRRKPNIILIYSDDHGYADLGVQGSVTDIRTPNLDALARAGVRFKRGYVSAPQCVPSRAGVLTGRYQERFGVEDNGKGPLPLTELTIAERLAPAGYVSCQIGKWHLDAQAERKGSKGEAAEEQAADRDSSFQPWAQGFQEYFTGPMNRFMASHDLQGHPLPGAPLPLTDSRFRCVWQADAAVSFIERHQRDPFFLYLAFFTPHVPLQSPEPWFSKTPADAPLERRQALAMIAAMDDGVGRVCEKLRATGLEKETLIFFIGDNGAPLKKGGWDGSLNLPLIGEKGMLTDGGIRTPFVAAWPGTIPAGQVFEAPVLNLDVAATAVAVAGLPLAEELDGINLMPFLLGEKTGNPHDTMFWRWRSQAAVRADHWKLILLGKDERYLFDLESAEGETRNRMADFPELAAKLTEKLMAWDATLPPPGLPREIVAQDQLFYDSHVKKTGAVVKKPVRGKRPARSAMAGQEWAVRNATSEVKGGAFIITSEAPSNHQPFIACSNLNLSGPAMATLSLRSVKGGKGGMAWRTSEQRDFPPGQTVSFDAAASAEWQEIRTEIPAAGKIIHLRILLPNGKSEIGRIALTPKKGGPGRNWTFSGEP